MCCRVVVRYVGKFSIVNVCFAVWGKVLKMWFGGNLTSLERAGKCVFGAGENRGVWMVM